MDMLALPMALVGPTSAKRLFLLETGALGDEVDSKECEAVRDQWGAGPEGLGDSVLTGDGRLEEVADEGD